MHFSIPIRYLTESPTDFCHTQSSALFQNIFKFCIFLSKFSNMLLEISPTTGNLTAVFQTICIVLKNLDIFNDSLDFIFETLRTLTFWNTLTDCLN